MKNTAKKIDRTKHLLNKRIYSALCVYAASIKKNAGKTNKEDKKVA